MDVNRNFWWLTADSEQELGRGPPPLESELQSVITTSSLLLMRQRCSSIKFPRKCSRQGLSVFSLVCFLLTFIITTGNVCVLLTTNKPQAPALSPVWPLTKLTLLVLHLLQYFSNTFGVVNGHIKTGAIMRTKEVKIKFWWGKYSITQWGELWNTLSQPAVARDV